MRGGLRAATSARSPRKRISANCRAMIGLWIAAALLSAGAAGLILRWAFLGARRAAAEEPEFDVYRRQMAEIDRLRTEVSTLVEWIMGDRDALTCLQATYNSTTVSDGNKIRAAAAAIGFERPKMVATTSLVVVDFRERVRQARLRAPFVEPKTIEHIP